MQGYRTIGVGLVMALLPTALQYLGGVSWEQYVPPQYVPVISGIIMIAMRFVTTTPVGVKK